MKKLLKVVVTLLVLGLIGSGVILYMSLLVPVVPDDLKQKDFIIHKGMSVSQIADTLLYHSFIKNRDSFLLAVRVTSSGNRLKAGRYVIESGSSHLDLLKTFQSGKSIQQRVTFPEGKTTEDFAEVLERKLSLDKQKFLELVKDSTLAQQLGIDASSFEGYLFPDTYYLNWGMTPLDVIRVLVREFHHKVNDETRTQIEKSELTLHEVVTLASIIEGEAVIDSERTVIAAVYLNRLKRGMLLQADPTIQYIVPGPPRRLLYRDLKIDSPYNTYRYPGLPPGPVNNPSLKSILAVLNPASVPYLYFVARGDGSHIFSRNLREHVIAKRKFNRVRARVRREKMQNSRNNKERTVR